MKKSFLACFAFIVILLSGWITSTQGGEPQRCRCCQPPAGEKRTLMRMEQRSYNLLDQSLYDERIMVLAARSDLLRWDRAARLRFRLWFGTDHPAARRYLFRTVSRIASDERNFVRSALMFHFGMAPRELNPFYLQPQENHDPDSDGVLDEVTEGNVSALTLFTMSIRPPEQRIPPEKQKIVERGRKLFLGEKVDDCTPVIGSANSCANCHVPSLPLYDTKVCVRDPRDDVKLGEPLELTNLTGLVAQQRSSKRLPTSRITRTKLKSRRDDFLKMLRAKKQPNEIVEAIHKAILAEVEPTGCPWSGYQFDLSMRPGSDFESLSFSYPRLPTPKGPHGKDMINVPLFSDLKRHDMGEGLRDKFDQPTDVASITVTRREFLTRPLWGVADTGPWLHDGRARTLRDAILMHESLGSEANPAIDAFKKLRCEDQAAIVEFLLTLHLPLDCRYRPCFDQPANCRPMPAPQPEDGRR